MVEGQANRGHQSRERDHRSADETLVVLDDFRAGTVTAMAEDMKFESEEAFRAWVQSELSRLLEPGDGSFVVLRSKNVNDIIICRESPAPNIAVFVEVKYAKASSGRIGVGDGRGGGFQPEILSRRPAYFEQFTRWLVASEVGVAVLADSNTVRRYAVGGEFREGKQNNIQPHLISGENGAFLLADAPVRIIEWLKSLAGAAQQAAAPDGRSGQEL